jgi:hypothetical protein
VRPFSNLANVILSRTYARKKPNYRYENWQEVVDRVVGGNTKGFNVSEEEIQRLKYFMMERKAGPAGRGLWMSGTHTHAKLGGAGLVNCWAFTADDWQNFVIALDLLCLGGGVGMSVESRYVYKLPRVKKNVTIIHKLTKDPDFLVPDTREGWVETIRKVFESWFVTGKSFSYSTICVRGPGEPINGFGGISSGPRPLIKAIEKINAVMIQRQGKQLHPIHIVDIVSALGELVVSGNIRRSALIFLGDPGDKEYLKAKRFDLGPIPTQRGVANFSVVADDADDDLGKLFWDTYVHGEPFGIVNRKNIRKYGRIGEEKEDSALLVNPCFRATSPVLTNRGIETIDDIDIGDVIWAGSSWTKVVNKESRGIKHIFAYRTAAGVFEGTANHKVLSYGEKVEVGKAKAIDTCQGPASSIKKEDLSPQDVLYGKCHFPKFFGVWIDNLKSTCGVLRGVYSANASVSEVNREIVLPAFDRVPLEEIQVRLSALGIPSYINEGEGVSHLRIRNRQGQAIFNQCIGFDDSEQKVLDFLLAEDTAWVDKKTYQIEQIEDLGFEEVFDITVEDPSHAFWSGNLHVANCGEACLENGEPCCLQNINLAAINNLEEFKEAAVLFHRYGKRVTMEKYHHEVCQDVISKNHRIGTSITGCLENTSLFNREALNEAYQAIQKENINYSKELGIRPSIRTTTVNPGGTVSKLYDCVCEGVHPAYSQYIIQRIRIAANDPLISKLKEAGHYMEPVERFDGTLDSDTYVVDFYVAAPGGAPCADGGFDTWKQLEALQLAQQAWADQSCSVTVYYDEKQLPKVKEWVTNNLNSIKSISFLKHSGHQFKQAPKEPITKEEYEKLSCKIKPIEVDCTVDGEVSELDGLGCEGGACPIR